MSEIDANAIVNEAISVLDEIEEAIEEQGVAVPAETPASDYDEKIREIETGVPVDLSYDPESENAQSGIAVAQALDGLPIKYVEGSSDADEVIYLRDLESGTYVLKGTFKPYVGSGTVCRFSSNLLVNVVKGTMKGVPTSHIQIFYPVNNVVQFCDITDSTYTRTDIKLNELAKATTVEEMIATANKAAQNLYANAFKATASGEVIRVDDVSPFEHTANVKVSGKNLVDISKAANANFIENDGVWTLTRNEDAQRFSKKVQLNIPANTTFTVSFEVLEYTKEKGILPFYFIGESGKEYYGSTTATFTRTYSEPIVALMLYLNSSETVGTYIKFKDFQIEEGDTATEYEPYIDPTTVTVTRCGKNVLPYPFYEKDKTLHGITFTDNKDGTITVNGTSTNNASFYFVYGGKLKLKGKYALSGVTGGAGDTYYVQPFIDEVAKGGLTNGYRVYDFDGQLTRLGFHISSGVTFDNFVVKLQLEQAETATDYEQYNGTTYTPSAEGIVEISTLSPTMTLLTDTAGVNIDVEYNQDANNTIGYIKTDITTLDNDMATLKSDIGSIDTALDSIIAMQTELIGGDDV